MSKLRKVPRSVWGKALVAGLGGGLTFGLFAMIVNWLLGDGFFWFPNAVGAIWPAFRPAGHAFAWGPSLLGMALHLAVSAVWGLVYAVVGLTWVPSLMRRWAWAAWLGAGWGVILWLGFGLWLGALADPAMLQQRPEIYYAGYLIDGLSTAWVFAVLVPKNAIAVTFAPPQAKHERVESPKA